MHDSSVDEDTYICRSGAWMDLQACAADFLFLISITTNSMSHKAPAWADQEEDDYEEEHVEVQRPSTSHAPKLQEASEYFRSDNVSLPCSQNACSWGIFRQTLTRQLNGLMHPLVFGSYRTTIAAATSSKALSTIVLTRVSTALSSLLFPSIWCVSSSSCIISTSTNTYISTIHRPLQ